MPIHRMCMMNMLAVLTIIYRKLPRAIRVR